MKKSLEIIAKIKSDFPTKFGLPRQSGLAPALISYIVFEPKYRNKDALRGLDEYSHLWVLWNFSQNEREGDWSPTVRPPKLGGNERVGVFATRSPFRPSPIGLSCVKIESIEFTENLPSAEDLGNVVYGELTLEYPLTFTPEKNSNSPLFR